MQLNKIFRLLPLATCLLLLNSCTHGTILSTHTTKDIKQVRGKYDLILYGGQNPHDFRTVAILDRTDDRYAIYPYGATFNYRIIKNLTPEEAQRLGNEFIRRITEYRATEKYEIFGPGHTVIGYELRPIYMPLAAGWLGDLLSTSYFLSGDDLVTVYISVKGEYSNREEFPRDDSRDQ